MIQLVTEPTVETPTLRPLRSSGVLTESSPRTTSAKISGGLAMAATPLTGEPFTMKASPGPEPSPISIPSAAIACWMRASPPKLLISMSMPCFLKMPVRAPMSAGTNENASRPALPTRRVSAAAPVAMLSRPSVEANKVMRRAVAAGSTSPRSARRARAHRVRRMVSAFDPFAPPLFCVSSLRS